MDAPVTSAPAQPGKGPGFDAPLAKGSAAEGGLEGPLVTSYVTKVVSHRTVTSAKGLATGAAAFPVFGSNPYLENPSVPRAPANALYEEANGKVISEDTGDETSDEVKAEAPENLEVAGAVYEEANGKVISGDTGDETYDEVKAEAPTGAAAFPVLESNPYLQKTRVPAGTVYEEANGKLVSEDTGDETFEVKAEAPEDLEATKGLATGAAALPVLESNPYLKKTRVPAGAVHEEENGKLISEDTTGEAPENLEAAKVLESNPYLKKTRVPAGTVYEEANGKLISEDTTGEASDEVEAEAPKGLGVGSLKVREDASSNDAEPEDLEETENEDSDDAGLEGLEETEDEEAEDPDFASDADDDEEYDDEEYDDEEYDDEESDDEGSDDKGSDDEESDDEDSTFVGSTIPSSGVNFLPSPPYLNHTSNMTAPSISMGYASPSGSIVGGAGNPSSGNGNGNGHSHSNGNGMAPFTSGAQHLGGTGMVGIVALAATFWTLVNGGSLF